MKNFEKQLAERATVSLTSIKKTLDERYSSFGTSMLSTIEEAVKKALAT